MAPRSFRLLCGPGPGETLLDEDSPGSIARSGRMPTCDVEEAVFGKQQL
jgi:hypothetical protein